MNIIATTKIGEARSQTDFCKPEQISEYVQAGLDEKVDKDSGLLISPEISGNVTLSARLQANGSIAISESSFAKSMDSIAGQYGCKILSGSYSNKTLTLESKDINDLSAATAQKRRIYQICKDLVGNALTDKLEAGDEISFQLNSNYDLKCRIESISQNDNGNVVLSVSSFDYLLNSKGEKIDPADWTGDDTLAGGKFVWVPYKPFVGESQTGSGAIADGYYCIAQGAVSHAEGNGCVAAGKYSHAEGYETLAGAYNSHAEGSMTSALAINSKADGSYCVANDQRSYVWSQQNKYQMPDGHYNAPYCSHGLGTYNINPINGISGFYISEYSLADYLSAKQQNLETQIYGNSYRKDKNGIFGNQTSCYTQNGLALGYKSSVSATGGGGVAAGLSCNVTGNYGVALGDETSALKGSSIATGSYCVAEHDRSFVWSGQNHWSTTQAPYKSKEVGSFCIYPQQGLSAFYISGKSFVQCIIDAIGMMNETQRQSLKTKLESILS